MVDLWLEFSNMSSSIPLKLKQFWVSVVLISVCCANPGVSYANPQTYKTINGATLNLDLKAPSNISFLIFWASWCSTCMAEIPEFKRLHSAYPNIRFIGVNVNKNPEDGLQIEKQESLPYPSIADPDLVLTDIFNFKGTPGFVLIDKDAKVLYKGNRLNKNLLSLLKSTNENAINKSQ